MADPVLKPLTVGPQVSPGVMQRVSDGSSSPGPGVAAARQMTGLTDASTAGGFQQDSEQKYRAAGIPDPLAGLLAQSMDDSGDAPVL